MPGPAHKSCPADLDAGWRAIWNVAHADISERGWRDAYHPTLERYVRSLRAASESLAVIKAHGMTTLGSTGQVVLSPHWKVYTEACRIADKCAADLLLTPAARARVGDQVPVAKGGKFDGKFG
jgi:P27 family predicted phage terminase small subunit